jgi:hypothetical protein
MVKKILIISVFFSLIFTSLFSKENKLINQYRGCDGKVEETSIYSQDQVPIKLIELDTTNYRKWTVNGIRILTSRYRYVEEKYKRRFDGTILITYENNIRCIFDARIRHSGDEKDHISLLGNSITQSLDIHLKNGNIRGITKFKLLRPKVRGVLEDEIFLTEVLRNLNYIAPRTIKVNARVNRITTTMLFQEKAAKEMLEYNNRREGPFFEGDERFFFKKVEKLEDNHISGWSIGVVDLMNQNAKYMLAKQINSEIITKSEGHKLMSLDSTSKLNLIYLYFASRFQDDLNTFNYMEYDLDNNLLALFDKKKTLKLDQYNLLIQAVNGQHGMAINNRKFYWNSIENYFEPINYDSNANISLGIAPGQVRLPISDEFLKSFPFLKKKLNNLDIKKLSNNLQLSGLKINEKKIVEKLEQIIVNITQLDENYSKLDKNLITHNKFKIVDKIVDNYIENLKKLDTDIMFVGYNPDNKEFNKCENFLENCNFLNISNENLSSLLEGDLNIGKYAYQYLGKNYDFKKFSKNNFNNSLKIMNTKVYHDDGVEINYNKLNNEIKIIQKVPGSKIIFLNGKLNETKISFIGEAINELNRDKKFKNFSSNYSSTDINGLTGCLTFSNLELNNVKIEASGSSCEDTVNLINVSGSIENIFIKDSYSDGLDIDFSNIKISNMNIKDAGNDCADFSSGKYNLVNLKLENCGDKALSIGEKSYVKLENIFANHADVGVASKDSSITIMKNASLQNLKTCISAYNKKQEFDGGVIKIDNLICINSQNKISADSRSKISQMGKNLNN